MEEFSNIRQAIDKLLNVRSSVKRKKQNKLAQEKELFVSIVNSLDQLNNRSNLAFTELQLDFSSYEEPYLEIIDALMLLKYGKEACEIISYYLWERVNPDGSINELHDDEDNTVPLETADDLWNLIQQMKQDENGESR